MKCPKCNYIGFRAEERCKNCGYDFSLAVDPPTAQDLPLRGERDPSGPLAEFSFNDLFLASKEDRERNEPEPDTRRTAVGERRPEPRAPLSVRRATPEVPKSRSRAVRERSEVPTLSFDWLPGEDSGPGTRSAEAAAPASESAGSRSRISAAFLDGGLLVAVDVTVIYLTLQLTMVNLGFALADAARDVPVLAQLGLPGGVYRGWWANPWQDGRWHPSGRRGACQSSRRVCRPANSRVCSLSPSCRFGLFARVLRSGTTRTSRLSRGNARREGILKLSASQLGMP